MEVVISLLIHYIHVHKSFLYKKQKENTLYFGNSLFKKKKEKTFIQHKRLLISKNKMHKLQVKKKS